MKNKVITGLLIFILLFNFQCINHDMKSQGKYTVSDIIAELESAYIAYEPSRDDRYTKLFPWFGNDEICLSSSRVNLFADSTRWAIVFETICYNYPGGRAELELNYFGNCLQNLYTEGTRMYSFNMLQAINLEELNRIADPVGYELVSRDAKTVKIRDKEFLIEHNVSAYSAKGIKISDYENPDSLIDFASLLIFLNEEHPEIFRATESELRISIPNDLPKIMTIDKWHHKDYYGPEVAEGRIGSYETYPMMAEVLVSKDTTKWKPTLVPNNDWKSWYVRE